MLLFELILSTVRCTILAIDIASKSVVSRGTRYEHVFTLAKINCKGVAENTSFVSPIS